MSSTNLSFLALLLSVFVFSVNVSAIKPVVKISAPDITKICSKTLDSAYCVALLKSDPRLSGAADYKTLASLLIGREMSQVASTKALIASLVSKTTTPELKKRYQSCLGYYDGAAGGVDDAKESLAAGDYNGVNIHISGAMTYIGDCQDSFDSPPSDPSALPANNKDLTKLSGIILVVSNLL